MDPTPGPSEWLEADGLGGFASGPSHGPRTRRYHGLLLVATTPPTRRVLLVSSCEVWVERGGASFALSAQRYLPDVVHPDGGSRVAHFEPQPWPKWTYRCEDGTEIVHELFVPKDHARAVLCWRLAKTALGTRLCVRPLLSGRDPHALTRENATFRFAAEVAGDHVSWQVHDGLPPTVATSNGEYEHAPDWYRNFLYLEERARGFDHVEDLASPGVFRFDLSAREAWLSFGTAPLAGRPGLLREQERARRAAFASPLHRAADAFVVRRGGGKTIVAGYPWFADWGRDTFISLRGLCLATGRLEDARQILVEWSGAVDRGMLPNRFVESGAAEFNAVDASLWFVVAVHGWLCAMRTAKGRVAAADRAKLLAAVRAILEGYAQGTRHGIRMDSDSLLACGEPGVQLTWMDAKVGDWVVTPRIGKPVEVQALWLNANQIAAELLGAGPWSERFEKGLASFGERFWNPETGCLYDVVDEDHVAGQTDASLRPNQIFAVGGLPHVLLAGERAERVVAVVAKELLTPLGLRSLASSDPRYRGRYEGGVRERDGAYHQGTVWPWLLGAFAEAWRRTHRGQQPECVAELLARCPDGFVPEIADGDAPHTARGCPFQAWSTAAVIEAAAHRGLP